ncbi:MAG: dipeptide epimerase [Lachnospiraceae bacterium]
MKITAIKTGMIQIPLVTPFKTALRTVEQVEDLIVCVETDTGEKGYGEAPPTAVITGDTLGSIETAIRAFIAPSIIGMEVENLDVILEMIQKSMIHNTSAKAAVDMAVYDLYAKSLNRPLYQILGGSKKELETDLTISVNSVSQMVEDSQKAIDRGFSILKIKVGKETQKDLERIREIRAAVGPDVKIRVDANQGWTPKQAVSIIQKMEDLDLGIALVEQPVAARDFEGMRFVTSHTATTILADESVFSPMDAIRLFEMQAADMVNIKLMKTGGIHEALKICQIAEVYQKECMVGCMLESKIAVSAAAHLAAAKSVITTVDLDGPSLCSIDPYTGGPLYEESVIRMTQDPGIGITGVPVAFS